MHTTLIYRLATVAATGATVCVHAAALPPFPKHSLGDVASDAFAAPAANNALAARSGMDAFIANKANRNDGRPTRNLYHDACRGLEVSKKNVSRHGLKGIFFSHVTYTANAHVVMDGQAGASSRRDAAATARAKRNAGVEVVDVEEVDDDVDLPRPQPALLHASRHG